LDEIRQPITGKWSRLKPEIEHGGPLYFERAMTSTNTKPKVVLSDRGRHPEKSI